MQEPILTWKEFRALINPIEAGIKSLSTQLGEHKTKRIIDGKVTGSGLSMPKNSQQVKKRVDALAGQTRLIDFTFRALVLDRPGPPAPTAEEQANATKAKLEANTKIKLQIKSIEEQLAAIKKTLGDSLETHEISDDQVKAVELACSEKQAQSPASGSSGDHTPPELPIKTPSSIPAADSSTENQAKHLVEAAEFILDNLDNLANTDIIEYTGKYKNQMYRFGRLISEILEGNEGNKNIAEEPPSVPDAGTEADDSSRKSGNSSQQKLEDTTEKIPSQQPVVNPPLKHWLGSPLLWGGLTILVTGLGLIASIWGAPIVLSMAIVSAPTFLLVTLGTTVLNLADKWEHMSSESTKSTVIWGGITIALLLAFTLAVLFVVFPDIFVFMSPVLDFVKDFVGPAFGQMGVTLSPEATAIISDAVITLVPIMLALVTGERYLAAKVEDKEEGSKISRGEQDEGRGLDGTEPVSNLTQFLNGIFAKPEKKPGSEVAGQPFVQDTSASPNPDS